MTALGRRQRLPMLLVGLYCWTLTVLPHAASEQAALTVQLAAVGALVCLCLGSAVGSEAWSLWLGVQGFVAGCAATWWLSAHAGQALQGRPLGLLGWMAFTFGWGALSTPSPQRTVEPEGGPATELQPRRRIPALEVGFLVLAPSAATLLLLPALAISRPFAAILGQVVAFGIVLTLVKAMASAATLRWLGTSPRPLRQLLRASWLPALGTGFLLGAAWYLSHPG